MIGSRGLVAAGILGLVLIGTQPSEGLAQESGWSDLFDGKSLDGWAVRGGVATYRVEDGTIVGTTAKGSPNTFLCKGDYGDFELTFEVKCDPRLNSGCQVRSHVYEKDGPDPIDPTQNRKAGVVYGPQCEIARQETGTAGRIYDEGRRGRWLCDQIAGSEAAYENDEWNTYRIVVQGNRYRSWVNGKACADMVDDVDQRGFIGLQVHGIGESEGPYEVRWRNVKIRELKPDETVADGE